MPAVTNFTTQPQLVVPGAAAGVSVTPNATAFVNSSYVQLTAGIASDIVMVGIITNPGSLDVTYNIEVGKGAATSETVAGTILGRNEIADEFAPIDLFQIPIFVAANTRLAVRMRKAGTSTVAWTFKLVYYELPAATSAFFEYRQPEFT
jgi:hypothetical protein